MSIIRERVKKERLHELFKDSYWYHTFDLGNDIVTNGTFDLRDAISAHMFPKSLEGKTVLDVGASDGFYSFEFEKRGAESILAIDKNRYDGELPIDPSPAKRDTFIEKHSREKREFEKYKDIFSLLGLNGSNKLVLLADYFDSKIIFRNHSIYELETLNKVFDFVFCGALIEHLKHPLLAIEQLRKVTGELCIISLSNAFPIPKVSPKSLRIKLACLFLRLMGLGEEISLNSRDCTLKYVGNISGGSFFNIHPNTFREMLLASDFKDVDIIGEYDVINNRYGYPNHNVVFHCRA
jgi:tRNA (mo5U34)-methyltransferase